MRTFKSKQEHLLFIKTCDNAYYESATPFISDNEYDLVRSMYIDLYGEKDLNYVAGKTSTQFEQYEFEHSIKSLGKIQFSKNVKEDLLKYMSKFGDIVIQPKIDGLTLVKKDNLIITRGNGFKGDIYPNSYLIKNMNSKQHNKLSLSFGIRGEAYISKGDFKEINQYCIENDLPTYENARNATAGILRGKSTKFLKYVKFLAYNLLDDGSKYEQTKQISTLSNYDYDTVDSYFFKKDEHEKAVNFILTFDKNTLPYDIDGLVIKSNEFDSISKFGETNHHPNNAIAYKFETEKAITKIIDIEYSLGRGKITPIAILNPVRLAGTTVSRASIHNLNIINELGLSIGSTVKIEKSNEIIPQITEVLEKGDIDFKVIELCPKCHNKIRITDNVLYCDNPECSGKLTKQIAHMASKSCLNIQNLSVSTANKLIEALKITNPFEILLLKEKDFLTLDGFAKKSAQKLETNILNAVKNTPLNKFIYASGISMLGEVTAKDIANKLRTYNNFINDIENDCTIISSINGIGSIIVSNIINEKTKILELKKYISPIDLPERTEETNNKAYTFVITGSLSQPRDYYKNLIEEKGSHVSNSVSKNTDYLLAGEDAGSKLTKAQTLGVKIISEKELNMLLVNN